MKQFDIYITGVGGQGVGLLSEMIIRAAHKSGHKVKGVDTHGLAQRGGIVVSRVRLGDAKSPLIGKNRADLVLALDITEAARAAEEALKPGGTLAFYKNDLQPLPVRLGNSKPVDIKRVEQAVIRKEGTLFIFEDKVDDPRMQNIVLLSHLVKKRLLPNITDREVIETMEDLMEGEKLKKNYEVYRKIAP